MLVLPEAVVSFPVPWLGSLAVVLRFGLPALLFRFSISLSCSDRITYPLLRNEKRERKRYATLPLRDDATAERIEQPKREKIHREVKFLSTSVRRIYRQHRIMGRTYRQLL